MIRILVLIVTLAGIARGGAVCGDCDLYGGVTVSDALLAARAALGILVLSGAPLRQCDANGSGAMEIVDALLIAQTAVELAPQLACPPDREWQQVTPPVCPEPRYYCVMAYDEVQAVTVLYGGIDIGVASYGDTWTWDGASWTDVTPPGPGPAVWAGLPMLFDPLTQSIILLDGLNGSCPLARRMWSWDGTTWAQLSPPNMPPARGFAGFVYEEHRGVATLFGGDVICYAYLNDQWEWDGTTWSEVFPASRPSGRIGAGMAYSAATQTTILFGGATDLGGGVFSDETWEWNGSTWRQLFPVRRPQARAFMSMTSDEVTGHIVLYGGWPLGASTWVWDSTSWWPAWAAMSPLPGRKGHGAAYDRARAKHVIFGGHAGGLATDETWEY
jgi:hypothetical protein